SSSPCPKQWTLCAVCDAPSAPVRRSGCQPRIRSTSPASSRLVRESRRSVPTLSSTATVSRWATVNRSRAASTPSRPCLPDGLPDRDVLHPCRRRRWPAGGERPEQRETRAGARLAVHTHRGSMHLAQPPHQGKAEAHAAVAPCAARVLLEEAIEHARQRV